ncbi:hypothetical protein ABFA07_008155 [Porites harrisoni]
MWLTTVLCRRWTPGRLFAGRNRLVRQINPATMRRKKVRLERRLSYIDSLTAVPFLTQPQEAGHSQERKIKEWKMFKEAVKTHKDKKMGAIRAFETQESKPKGILQHLDVARTQHE